MVRETLGYEPAAYLSNQGNGKVIVVSRGSAVSQGDRVTMLAYLRKHWPKVTPTEWVVEGDVGTFYVIEED